MFDNDSLEIDKQIRITINRLPLEYSQDLRRMLLTLEQLNMHLNCEKVRCRQRGKITKEYTGIKEKITEYKEHLEEQLVIACLMS